VNETILHAYDVSFLYPGQLELKIPDFRLRRGDFAVIIGPNAIGKSTFCKLLARILLPRKGCVELASSSAPPILIWQESELFPGTVSRNMQLVRRNQSENDEILRGLKILDQSQRNCSQLSGGVRQKVAIARALAAVNCSALIYDEPTRSLDPRSVGNLAEVIRKVRTLRENIATVVVTHEERLVTLLTDMNPSFYVLERTKGNEEARTVAQLKGPYEAEGFLTRPPTLYAAEFLGFENILRIRDSTVPATVRNLMNLDDHGAVDPSGSYCVVPPQAIEVASRKTPGFEAFKTEAVEYRRGGIRLIRSRLDDQTRHERLRLLIGRRKLETAGISGDQLGIPAAGVDLFVRVDPQHIVRVDHAGETAIT
jgi:ABC-type cobalamin/Fe3+-siderophores transport system ATPase subunit